MQITMCIKYIVILSLLSVVYTRSLATEENLRKYYTCYINKYFQKDVNSNDSGTETIVEQVVEEAIANKDPFPTENCVEWICDPRVLWKISNNRSLEILAYYSLEQNFVPSWQPCLEDEAQEFVKRNYTQIRAGYPPGTNIFFFICVYVFLRCLFIHILVNFYPPPTHILIHIR